ASNNRLQQLVTRVERAAHRLARPRGPAVPAPLPSGNGSLFRLVRWEAELLGDDRDIERIDHDLVDHAVWLLAQLVAAALVSLGLGTVAILVRRLLFTPPSA
ncbi:MAG TPA: hypothetical protein VLL75_02275, partial [Vicinamibacteria bacterium]|nr:hypothetical protein [Vicinamibacteria bacterium]